MKMPINAHELGFVEFLERAQQRRVKALLSRGAEGQKKFRKMLAHDILLEPRFMTEAPVSKGSAESILRALQQRGAPEQCYALSENSELDRQSLPLQQALALTVGRGFGCFLSCIPGRLGYYEYEGREGRFILMIK